jgi:hypothetical protein
MTRFNTVAEFNAWQEDFNRNYMSNLRKSMGLQPIDQTHSSTIICGTHTIGGDFSRGSSPTGFSSSSSSSSISSSSSSSTCSSTGATISSLFGR